MVHETDIDDSVPTSCTWDSHVLSSADNNILNTDWDQNLNILAIVGNDTDDRNFFDIPNTDVLLRGQMKDTFLCKRADESRRVGTKLEIENSGVLFNHALFYGMLQLVILQTMPPVTLWYAHSLRTAGHTEARQRYDNLNRQYCWAHRETDGYGLVEQC